MRRRRRGEALTKNDPNKKGTPRGAFFMRNEVAYFASAGLTNALIFRIV